MLLLGLLRRYGNQAADMEIQAKEILRDQSAPGSRQRATGRKIEKDVERDTRQPLFRSGAALCFVFLPLTGYYLAPYFHISRHVTWGPYLFAIVLFVYIIGSFFTR